MISHSPCSFSHPFLLFKGKASFSCIRKEISDKSLWDITGQATYEGRNCAVIEGVADPSYGDKFDVTTFIMYVDSETGILLKYEGFNEEGTKTDFIEVTDFSLTPKLTKSSAFSLDKYSSYTCLTPSEEVQAINEYLR